MRSFFLKIFGASILLVILLVLLVLVFSLRLIRAHTMDILTGELEHQARVLEPALVPYLETGDASRLNALVRDLALRLEVRVTVIAPDGTVLADSLGSVSRMDSHLYRPEIQDALEKRTGRSVRYSQTLKADMLYVSQPLGREGKALGVLRLSTFVQNIDRMMSDLRRRLWYLAAAAALAALVVSFFISRNLARPIEQMIKVSRRISAGDFEAKVYLLPRDKVGDLGRSLNSMTCQVKSLVENLRRTQEEWNEILESMEEGLVLLDEDDRVRLCNRSFKRIFSLTDPEGKYSWEVVRNSAFGDLVRRIKAERLNLSERIQVGDRTFRCSASHLDGPGRVLAVFHDLTEAARMEENVDLVELAEKSLKLFEPAARRKGLGLRLEAEKSPLTLRGDPFRLEQVFLNLLDNAVKYTDSGEVVVSLEAEQGRAVVRVQDTGIGIPPEHLPQVFERFYVVDPSRSRKLGGTGLGLSIVKHIALLHGGEVSVSSVPDRGTCFTVRLPLPPPGE